MSGHALRAISLLAGRVLQGESLCYVGVLEFVIDCKSS